MNIKVDVTRHYGRFIAFLRNQKPRNLAIAGGLLFLVICWIVSKTLERETRVYQTKTTTSFEGSRILGSSKEIYERQGMLLENRVKNMESSHRAIKEAIEALAKKVETPPPPSEGQTQPPTSETPPESQQDQGEQKPDDESLLNAKPREFLPEEVSRLRTEQVAPGRPSYSHPNVDPIRSTGAYGYHPPSGGNGPAIISFPVDGKPQAAAMGVVLPIGSFVKGKILSGVEAPEGKALPVLLQADFAFVGPNKTRIDLSGCFMIAKSTGNLSIERVEMQATKLSCVSKSGQMFERDINGYVADDKDNSFAVMGSVNTKQDRVAVMAFLSSVVEGVGKAVQQAQTTTQTNAEGVSSTIVGGDQTKYIAAGGASNAATMVTQWYLKQAQNYLPTINVGSGQDIWIVMQETVSLPNSYFKRSNQNRRGGNVYSYLSRVID